MGKINYRVSDIKGHVCGIKVVREDEDLILISNDGIIIRIAVADVNIMSRYAGGVRVMRLSEGDRVVAFCRCRTRGRGGRGDRDCRRDTGGRGSSRSGSSGRRAGRYRNGIKNAFAWPKRGVCCALSRGDGRWHKKFRVQPFLNGLRFCFAKPDELQVIVRERGEGRALSQAPIFRTSEAFHGCCT